MLGKSLDQKSRAGAVTGEKYRKGGLSGDNRARAAGAAGGKILGAGMGGFLMLFCDPRRQGDVARSLPELRRMQFGFEPEGSRIVYAGR